MTVKWLGAGLILLGCGGFGLCLVGRCRKEEGMVRTLLYCLEWMERELRYHVTPLPELCRQAACQISGPLRKILFCLAQGLDEKTSPDVSVCMEAALRQKEDLSPKMKKLLRFLGASLGCFDLAGQLEGLQGVQAACKELLDSLRFGREQRLRSYQTLSLCAGAALVILLI